MTNSVQFLALENFARSSNLSDYGEDGWQSADAGLTYSAPLGKEAIFNGGYPGAFFQKSLGTSPPSALCAGFRFVFTVNNPCSFYLSDYSGNQQVIVSIAANLIMTISDSAGVKYTTPFPLISLGTAYYLEVYATCSTASGTIEVFLNQVQVGTTITGAHTNSAGAGAFSFFGWDGMTNSNYNTFYTTDIYAFDPTVSGNPSGCIGDTDVQWLPTTANYGSPQFTPNGMSQNWQNLAVNPPNAGTDYNSSPTVGAYDSFTVGTLATLTASVLGVMIKSAATNTSGGLHTYKNGWSDDTGGTFVSGATNTLTNGVLVFSDSPQTNPVTSAAWTVSTVNGMKIRQTLVS